MIFSFFLSETSAAMHGKYTRNMLGLGVLLFAIKIGIEKQNLIREFRHFAWSIFISFIKQSNFVGKIKPVCWRAKIKSRIQCKKYVNPTCGIRNLSREQVYKSFKFCFLTNNYKLSMAIQLVSQSGEC